MRINTMAKDDLHSFGKVLVVGSTSFIGGHLLKRLQRLSVNVYDIAGRQDCDLLDYEAVKKRLADVQPDIIVLLAASPDTRQKISDYPHDYYNTIHCTLNILLNIPPQKYCLVIHVGSYKQYGKIPIPFHESAQTQPSSAYALAKMVAERLVGRYDSACLATVCLRLGPVFGPGQSSKSLIPFTVQAILNNRSEELVAVDVPWDPLFIDDAVDAIILCFSQPKVYGKIINISNGVSWTPQQIMFMIAELMNTNISPGEFQPTTKLDPPLPCVGDVSLAQELLGWRPQISIRDGLKRTIDYYKKII